MKKQLRIQKVHSTQCTELEKKRESILSFLKIWSIKLPPMFNIMGNMKGDGSVKRGSKSMW